MARYTELFAEYLEGGRQLPTIFQSIAGFDELFIGTYADREIGFETEDLFEMKLETKANLVIPYYSNLINKVETLKTMLLDPNKQKQAIHDIGATKGLQWVLPFNSNVADPSNKAETDATQNVDTEVESGLTSSEILAIIEHLTNASKNIKQMLLDEFRCLFMVVL